LEGIKRRLNLSSACYLSVQNLLPTYLLSKNIRIAMYETMILHVVAYGCETWPLIFREEHTSRMFEKRMVKEYLDQRGMK
jgi:hypothetical protein